MKRVKVALATGLMCLVPNLFACNPGPDTDYEYDESEEVGETEELT